MRAAIGGAVLIGVIFMGVAARAETLHFHAKLSGAAEAPPNQSHGAGLAELTLDTDSKLLDWVSGAKSRAGGLCAGLEL
jgi:hypothetical protein